MTEELRAISWLAMTRPTFNEDQIAELLYELIGDTLGLDASIGRAERLGYCRRIEITNHRHQIGQSVPRVWASALWDDTPQEIGSET
jgi:hypothetical protein